MKYIKLAVIAIVVSMFSPLTVQATEATPPNFLNCKDLIKNPGTKSSTKEGNHYIAGQTEAVSGSDDVYFVGDYTIDGNVTQCFCPLDGKGIQTNWWKTDTEVEGWIKIENGSWWDLHEGKYLAKNTEFNCKEVVETPPSSGSSSGSRPRPKPTPSITPTGLQMPTVASVKPTVKPEIYPQPQVAGATNTLPRTGIAGWMIVLFALGATAVLISINRE